jgi:hypothetical protein
MKAMESQRRTRSLPTDPCSADRENGVFFASSASLNYSSTASYLHRTREYATKFFPIFAFFTDNQIL